MADGHTGRSLAFIAGLSTAAVKLIAADSSFLCDKGVVLG
jgi:hypothetical protein